MLARVGGFIHRYAITGVYTCLGLLNAQSWPYLLVFIAFGAAIDIWLVKPSVPQRPKAFELLTEEELRREHAKWYKLLPYIIGLPLLGLALLLTLRAIAQRNPDFLVGIGPMFYEFTSPFINLLRVHYQDLLAHGLPERAAVVAANYSGMFVLFYLGLGPWLAAIKNMRLGKHPRRDPPQGLKVRLALLVMPPVMVLLIWFTIYVTTWMGIDYMDEEFRRRHINQNVAKYDAFFWEVGIHLGAFAAFVPVLYFVFWAILIKKFKLRA